MNTVTRPRRPVKPIQSRRKPCPVCPVCRADPQELLSVILPDLAVLRDNREGCGPDSPAYRLLLKVVADAVERLGEDE